MPLTKARTWSAGLVREVLDHRRGEPLHDLRVRRHRLAVATRLTVDADAISISSSPSSKLGSPELGVMHGVSATPMLRPPALTRRAISATSASGRRSSAAAPAIFSAITVMPTPRRPAVYRLSCTGHVVVGDDRLDLDALGLPRSEAMSKF